MEKKTPAHYKPKRDLKRSSHQHLVSVEKESAKHRSFSTKFNSTATSCGKWCNRFFACYKITDIASTVDYNQCYELINSIVDFFSNVG